MNAGAGRGELSENFEVFLARHCAPVLLKIKPAALVPERALPRRCEWPRLREHGIHMLRLERRGRGAMVLVFCPELISGALSEKRARRALSELGYPVELGWASLVAHLRRRAFSSAEFPHEIGFFLGYPTEDVLGFMGCGRGECKLCGMWKVYGDVERAERLFERYARCRETLLAHVMGGGSLFCNNMPLLTG